MEAPMPHSLSPVESCAVDPIIAPSYNQVWCLRQKAERVPVVLSLSDEFLTHLGSSAGKFAECGDDLGVEGDALASKLVETLFSNDYAGGDDSRGEGPELGFLAHGPSSGCGDRACADCGAREGNAGGSGGGGNEGGHCDGGCST